MKLNRNYITPFVSLIFFVVALTGVLMFFHLFDSYTEVAHECLGIVFVVCAACHIIINWKGLKTHFMKGVFIPAAVVITVISVVFVIFERLYLPVDIVLFNRIIKAPIEEAFKALEVNYSHATERLKQQGISIHGAKTIEDIWKINDADPEEVIDLIME